MLPIATPPELVVKNTFLEIMDPWQSHALVRQLSEPPELGAGVGGVRRFGACRTAAPSPSDEEDLPTTGPETPRSDRWGQSSSACAPATPVFSDDEATVGSSETPRSGGRSQPCTGSSGDGVQTKSTSPITEAPAARTGSPVISPWPYTDASANPKASFAPAAVPVPVAAVTGATGQMPYTALPPDVLNPQCLQNGFCQQATTQGQRPAAHTVTVRNIPEECTKQQLLQEMWDAGFRKGHDFDFLYVPCDARTGLNLGCCFVNFVDDAAMHAFIASFSGRETRYTSERRTLTAKAADLNDLAQVLPTSQPPPQKAPSAAQVRFCSQCGAGVHQAFSFCAQCGAPVATLGRRSTGR